MKKTLCAWALTFIANSAALAADTTSEHIIIVDGSDGQVNVIFSGADFDSIAEAKLVEKKITYLHYLFSPFPPGPIPEGELADLISHCSSLTDLGINDLRFGQGNLKHALSSLRALRELDADSAEIDDDLLRLVLDNNPHLRSLCLSGCKDISEKGILDLAGRDNITAVALPQYSTELAKKVLALHPGLDIH